MGMSKASSFDKQTGSGCPDSAVQQLPIYTLGYPCQVLAGKLGKVGLNPTFWRESWREPVSIGGLEDDWSVLGSMDSVGAQGAE